MHHWDAMNPRRAYRKRLAWPSTLSSKNAWSTQNHASEVINPGLRYAAPPQDIYLFTAPSTPLSVTRELYFVWCLSWNPSHYSITSKTNLAASSIETMLQEETVIRGTDSFTMTTISENIYQRTRHQTRRPWKVSGALSSTLPNSQPNTASFEGPSIIDHFTPTNLSLETSRLSL